MRSKEVEDAEKELTMESLRKIKEYMKDMKENHQYCSCAEQEAIRYLELYINDSTPKQLIRDKIEEFKRVSAEIRGYNYEDMPEDLKRNDYAVKILEDLIKE